MKTPLSYYGGKQQLAGRILDRIPAHTIYCEPFCGGAAVFFRKPKSKVEILNDTNRELINFYEVVQNDFVELEKEIRISLHSRDLHRKAGVIYQNPDMFSRIKRAWAIWMLANISYVSKLDGSFAYDRVGTTSIKIKNKRESFTEDYAIRLQDVQVECTDALRVIRSRDTPTTFFYVDPPYFNSDMGHYDGYTIEDFEMLLECLSKIQGRFILSSYRSDVLKEYSIENGWQTEEVKLAISASSKKREKIEVLTYNS